MGRKAKISYEIKFKFIEEYLNGNISQIAIARELGLHPSSIQGWIRKYKAFGPEGLKTIKKNTHYSSDRKSTRLNSSHRCTSRMPSSA